MTRRGVATTLVGAACQASAVVVFGTGPRAQRLTAVEELLDGGGGTRAEVSALAATEIQATDDLHTSSWNRREVAAALVGVVVEESADPGGSRLRVVLTVNGRPWSGEVPVRLTLSDLLRTD